MRLADLPLQNFPPSSPDITRLRPVIEQCTPPGHASTALGLRHWQHSAFASPPFRAISPSSKPALRQQRDHSACRHPDAPLRVKKTRENLKNVESYPNLVPPCLHICALTQYDSSKPYPRELEASTSVEPVVRSVRYDDSTNNSTQTTLPPYTPQDYAKIPPPPRSLPDSPRMVRQKSVSRRMLSRVKQGISTRTKDAYEKPVRATESETSLFRRLSSRRKQSSETERRAQSFEISRNSVDSTLEEYMRDASGSSRSFIDSTVSTSEILDHAFAEHTSSSTPSVANGQIGLVVDGVSPSPPPPPSPTPEPTPRPSTRLPLRLLGMAATTWPIEIPYIALNVSMDYSTLDVGAEKDVWIAIEATVCTQVHDSSNAAKHQDNVLGAITSLRLCYKPAHPCHILDIVGQKVLKDLQVGDTCSLFVRVHVPKIEHRGSSTNDKECDDQASLFTDLESMVGTLETEVLHVEARYRHALLPHDNVVTVRHNSSIRRPKIDSRWSIIDAYADPLESLSESVCAKLAKYLAEHYPAERALRLLDRYISAPSRHDCDVQLVRQKLVDSLTGYDQASLGDTYATASIKPRLIITDNDLEPHSNSVENEHFSTAPCTPSAEHTHNSPSALKPAHRTKPRSASLMALKLSPPPTTPSDCQPDEARTIWRHIRHSSLTAEQLVALATPEQDEALLQLQRRAVANKRSVGAETLRGWKWEEKTQELGRRKGEAPWL